MPLFVSRCYFAPSLWRLLLPGVVALSSLSQPLPAQSLSGPVELSSVPVATPWEVRRTLNQLPEAPAAATIGQTPRELASNIINTTPEWQEFAQQLQASSDFSPVLPTEQPPVATRPVRSEPLRSAARRLKLPLPLPNANIVVLKAQRRLELRSGNKVVKSYRVALGANPQGHKQAQGDNRTPEGRYFICTRNNKTSDFHIFLGLSYPALPDADRGLNQQKLTPREYQVIRQRLASRSAPLWRTQLGGWIGIHGGTGQKFANQKIRERKSSDWTAGCVALTNTEIEEIYAATKMGTPVFVRP
jgi:hypothetical protein